MHKWAEAEAARLLAREQAARERAERSEANLRAIVAAAPLPTVTIDPADRVQSWNGAAERVFGWTEQEVIGRPLPTRPPEELRTWQALLARAIAGEPVHTAEVRRRRKDGSSIDMLLSLAPFQAGAGQESGLVGMLIDITPQKQAEARIQRQVDRLSALRAIDSAITTSLDLRITLGIFLDQVTAQLGVHAAAVLLLDPGSHALACAAGRGFRGSVLARTRLRLGEGLAGRAALERQLLAVPDLAREPIARTALTTEEGFVTYYGTPLIAKGEVKGVLEVFHREPLQPEPDWLEFLEALAGQAAIALDNAAMFERLQRSNTELSLAYETTIEGWSRALDLRDKETEGHSQRVTHLTLKLARALGLSEAEQVHVRRGALLHDIGKMGVPDAILLKPGPLTEEEWAVMRQHPTYAHALLSPIAYLRPALDIPYCHHEKWDGTGYPRGLKGEQIPLAARIFAVVDVWDALRSDRPYRPSWPAEKVRAHIRALAGSHFDPCVVQAFGDLAEDRASG